MAANARQSKPLIKWLFNFLQFRLWLSDIGWNGLKFAQNSHKSICANYFFTEYSLLFPPQFDIGLLIRGSLVRTQIEEPEF